MRGFWARTMVILIALVAVGGTAPVAADPVPIPRPHVFTSADVGFIDGSDQAGRPGRIAEMDAYVGDKKPIIRLDLSWDRVQPCATCPLDWAALDAVVDVAYAQGVHNDN